jgi:peptidoglycan/LPS O-acetylase OafA/YrhL
MIQRIQSIWLLLAALCNAGLFYFDFYRSEILANGVTTVTHLRVNDHYPSLLIALVITVIPLVTIFMFKQRKRQRMMAVLSLVFTIGFISSVIMRVGNVTNDMAPGTGTSSYWIGAVLPIIAIIFLVMAIRGINKDEKLVKSTDRLR